MSAITIRFPKTLHQEVRRLAEEEGISINQFVVLTLAQKVAVMQDRQKPLSPAEQLAYLERKAQAAPKDETLASFLEKHALDEEPAPEDRLD